MNLLKLAVVPPVTVTPQTSVLAAVEMMDREGVGAVAIVDGDRLSGILTERDVVRRVTIRGRPADTTSVADVMTTKLEVAHTDTDPSKALGTMASRNFRHLPIVDENNKILGMLSLRHLLHRMVHDLSSELDALEAYVKADGPGG